ncbi:MAG: DedA family protein [Parvibaculum sp.]|nr:DedA family protein [Parvibaculum sp.]
MTGLSAYAALFLAAFIAATLLPAQSEAVLAGLLVAGEHPALALVIVAGIGNVLGSLVNYVLGRAALRFQERRWFPASPASLARASGWYARYGRWSLLLSWAPVIGDPLTVAAGVMREPLWSFLALVTIAKLGRYAILAGVTLQVI